MDLHPGDYAVFAFLLLISALVGPYYMWRDRHKPSTSESYFAGNRGLHIIPTAASLFASFWSAVALVGIPVELYTGGAKFFMSSIGQAIGIVIGAYIAVPMVYNLKLISSFEYFELRFKSRLLRKIGTVANIFASAFYLAVVTFSPCIALEAVSPIPVWASVIGTAAITLVYTVLGGLKAVVLVDFLQAIVMFGGVLVGVIVGFWKIEGGFTRAMEIAYEGGRLDFFDFNPDPTNTYNFWIMVFSPILANAGLYATSQAAVQRYSALPTVRQATWSVLSLAPQILVLKILLFFLALAMFAHYDSIGCDPLRGGIISSPNQLTTFYIADILHYPGMVGLWFAALFSGSLSTMSTGYNSVAACIWEDLLKEKLQHRLTPVQVSRVFKLISFLLGVVTCGLAIGFKYLPGSGSVVKLSNLTTSIFGAAIYIAFFNGALFPWVNATGTITGMVFATIGIFFMSVGQLFFKVSSPQNSLPTKTANCSAFKAHLIASGKLKLPSVNNFTTITTGLLLLTSPSNFSTIKDGGDNTTLIANYSAQQPTMQLFSVANRTLSNLTRFQRLPMHRTTAGTEQLHTFMNRTLERALERNTTSNHTNTIKSINDQKLPKSLQWLFSVSYFIFPFLSLLAGVVVAILISLCTDGVAMAKKVHPRFMIVKNCFFKGEVEEECKVKQNDLADDGRTSEENKLGMNDNKRQQQQGDSSINSFGVQNLGADVHDEL